MTGEVREARHQGGGLPGLGRGGGREGARRRRHRLRRGRAGLRRLLLRRLDLRPARGLRARPDRHPGRQRQQQLLDRLVGALPGPPGGQGRPGRLRARARLREDGEGLARREVHRPHQPDRQARDGDVRGARAGGVAVRAADVRQRRPRAHGEVRLRARPLRLDRLEEPQALGQQPVRAVPGRVLARGDQGRADDPRAADQAPVLADLRRLRLRDRRQRALRRRARPVGPGGRDRRPGDGHRPAVDLRGALDCIKIVGYDMSKKAARAGLRGGRGRRRRTSTSSSCTTASAPTS